MVCDDSEEPNHNRHEESPFDDEQRASLTRRFIESAEYLNRQFYLGRVGVIGEQDISLAQTKALMLLHQSGPIRMNRLAIGLGRTFSATSSLVDRLAEKGLLGRLPDPTDRRAVICEITEQGVQALDKSWGIGADRLTYLCEIMSDEQLVAGVVGLETIIDAEREVQRIIAELGPEVLPRPY